MAISFNFQVQKATKRRFRKIRELILMNQIPATNSNKNHTLWSVGSKIQVVS